MKKVVIYTSSTCSHCHHAMEYLDSKNIPYEEKNVSKDPEARKYLLQKKILGVPAIYIDDELIMGFDEAKINELLGI
ncbi:MAG: glutaredoxin family protein [Proteocatella sp.]|jgi:glutaredoxin 3|nr:glutaredoxin family protein [Proteocatella sp.]NCB72227.1 glutaredoxin family protein [Clostridia bacterium]MBP7908298.1 glutaredoxin family protein [Proteocatella sp.]MBP7913409.1 glutaredoxin family protein [Proteocatella sp.]MBP8654303.1 glutaredoxin family protein [Proteocatella sp.]